MRFHQALLVLAAILVGSSLTGCGGGGGRAQVRKGTVTGVKAIHLDAQDMIYNPSDSRIYASIASSGGPYANSLVAIDPSTATVTASVNAGSNPCKLALSKDGQVLYVAIDAAVQQISLPSMALGQRIDLGSDEYGLLYAEDIAVSPGDPRIVAVSLMSHGVDPKHRGVAIFDNGVRRPVTTPDHTGANAIEFSDDSTLLYGFCNESTEFGFRRMRVSDQGVSVIDLTEDLISGFGADIIYAKGLIFTSYGEVVSPSTLRRVHLIDDDGVGKVMAVNALEGKLFAINDYGYMRWYNTSDFSEAGEGFAFDTTTQVGVVNKCMTSFGTSGVAVGTDTQQIYFVTIGN